MQLVDVTTTYVPLLKKVIFTIQASKSDQYYSILIIKIKNKNNSHIKNNI